MCGSLHHLLPSCHCIPALWSVDSYTLPHLPHVNLCWAVACANWYLRFAVPWLKRQWMWCLLSLSVTLLEGLLYPMHSNSWELFTGVCVWQAGVQEVWKGWLNRCCTPKDPLDLFGGVWDDKWQGYRSVEIWNHDDALLSMSWHI